MQEPKANVDLADPLTVPDLDEMAEKGKSSQERMRAMERINIPGSFDATELSLVLGLVIPHKFKAPTFDKYDGTKCPTTHLTMYFARCRHTQIMTSS